MSAIEVLAPLRIETRFYAPDPYEVRWRMRLRVYPDEFSMKRTPPIPSPAELDLLDEVLAAPYRDPPVETEAAFLAFADKVGPPRAVWLMRSIPREEVAGVPRASRIGAQVRDENALPDIHKPDGLPPQLDVWLVLPAGQGFSLAATMILDRGAIAQDLDLSAFQNETLIRDAELPRTWWTSFERAQEVGLAIEIKLDLTPPDFEAIVVCGLGDQSPQALVDAHAATGRLAVLAPGTSTNTVEGEPTTELGRDPTAWLKLLTADVEDHHAAQMVIGVLSGQSVTPVPLLGGDMDVEGHRRTIVRALWPVLWHHSLRDMEGAGAAMVELEQWASEHLAPQGPYPAIRVGEQPYGLLPATTLQSWEAESNVEERIREWTVAWRQMAADAAEKIGNVVDASTERLVELLGETAPTRRWGIRPLASLAIIRAIRAAAGMPTIDPTAWEQATARALADIPSPLHPLAPFAGVFPLPPPPRDRRDKPDILWELLDAGPGYLEGWRKPLGLLGHLIGESLMLMRAQIGLAKKRLDAGISVDPNATLPLNASPGELFDLIFTGNDTAVEILRNSFDQGANELAQRFQSGMESIVELVKRWELDEDGVFAALLASLDTACHRVDPWITGIADARLKRLMNIDTPFYVGAYGWVDRPRPFTGGPGSPPPPGPTPAGLLHAPSYAQALTSALLRDAAVRYPGEDRWQINIDSAKVRAAIRLSERVRLGVHPYEALGLEVERLVGSWDDVRFLRQNFPLRTSHEGQRCCDGARVLRVVLHGSEPLPPDLPPGIAALIEPLDHVLDTYADLLIADGVHALVSGQGELGNAAMEAAAGLGAPPELRAMRTPRGAQAVRVSAWAMLPPGVPGDSPVSLADPAFVALLDDELGQPSSWLWRISEEDSPISVADRGLHGAEILDLGADALASMLRGDLGSDALVVSISGAHKLAAANRLAELLGGGDANPPVPDPDSGRDDAKTASNTLRQAMLGDLASRLQQLRAAAMALVAELDAADPTDEELVSGLQTKLRRWRALDIYSDAPLNAGRATLAARIKATESVAGLVNPLRLAIRTLTGQPRLPVIPIVEDAYLNTLALAPVTDAGRPVTDSKWLETVAAVRPRLALLEARQFHPTRPPWPAAIATGDGSGDPWTVNGPVVVAYGPGVTLGDERVALAGLDAWVDSIPSSQHVTSAAFGFNGPKARPPQAILIGVPPDPNQRMDAEDLAETVMEVRLLAKARALRPSVKAGSRVSTPSSLASPDTGFLRNWWT